MCHRIEQTPRNGCSSRPERLRSLPHGNKLDSGARVDAMAHQQAELGCALVSVRVWQHWAGSRLAVMNTCILVHAQITVQLRRSFLGLSRVAGRAVRFAAYRAAPTSQSASLLPSGHDIHSRARVDATGQFGCARMCPCVEFRLATRSARPLGWSAGPAFLLRWVTCCAWRNDGGKRREMG